MIEWKLARLFLALTLVAFIAGSFAVHGQQSAPPPAMQLQMPKEAGGDPSLHPNSPIIPWPQDFREDYGKLNAIQGVIQDIEDSQKALSSLRTRADALKFKLAQRIPPGYTIDEQNGRFVQLPPPPVPEPPGPLKQPGKKPEKP